MNLHEKFRDKNLSMRMSHDRMKLISIKFNSNY